MRELEKLLSLTGDQEAVGPFGPLEGPCDPGEPCVPVAAPTPGVWGIQITAGPDPTPFSAKLNCPSSVPALRGTVYSEGPEAPRRACAVLGPLCSLSIYRVKRLLALPPGIWSKRIWGDRKAQGPIPDPATSSPLVTWAVASHGPSRPIISCTPTVCQAQQ